MLKLQFDGTLLEYENPKYDGDLARPNCFVPVSEANLSRKIAHLFTHYATQTGKQWFTEGFYTPKVVL